MIGQELALEGAGRRRASPWFAPSGGEETEACSQDVTFEQRPDFQEGASQDYICPRCESGFIEELPEETRSTENGSAPSTAPSDQSRPPFENVDQHLFTLPQGYGQFAFGIFDDSFEIPTFPSGVQADEGRDPESRREREQHSRHRYGARQPRARLTARRATGRHEGVPTLEGIIQQLVNGIITPASIPSLGLGPWGVLHSNPMDYAWGANGLDAIITQLLNQFENTGPPPADKEKIQALPTVPVTEEHAPGWSVPCARTTTGWESACGSCPAATSSTTPASCPGCTRQLPRVPEEPHGTEHGHQPPGPDRRELLVFVLLVLVQLPEQRKPSRQLLSALCRLPREGAGPRPSPDPAGVQGGRGAAGLEPGGAPAPASLPALSCAAARPEPLSLPRGAPAQGPGTRRPSPVASNLTLYTFDGGKVFIILNYYCSEINGRFRSRAALHDLWKDRVEPPGWGL
uniref:Ring finger protein 126 n=1 Tax=Suricata suricatta TaxID=37032 RepID=A0A673TM61_SURSU